jgi:hypothetical protein
MARDYSAVRTNQATAVFKTGHEGRKQASTPLRPPYGAAKWSATAPMTHTPMEITARRTVGPNPNRSHYQRGHACQLDSICDHALDMRRPANQDTHKSERELLKNTRLYPVVWEGFKRDESENEKGTTP